MALTDEPTTFRRCTACGDWVALDANFCSTCGTRQADGIPRPVEPEPPARAVTPVDDAVAAGATAGLIVVAVLVAVLLLALGLLVGRLFLPGGGDGGSAAGPAARAMDRYAPIAAGWEAKRTHVGEEGAGGDAAGLATAARDAAAWIDVNGEDLSAAAADVPGDAGPLYGQLVDIYARRFSVLGDIERTATAGGTGLGAAADELAQLDALDQQAATATCAIANVMRSEGDDPADHLTPAMDVNC